MRNDVESQQNQSRPMRPIFVGGVLCLVSLGMMAMPLVIGQWEANKYLVAVGFLVGCWGTGCVIHGLWDLWRG
jgi:hypothetical protein